MLVYLVRSFKTNFKKKSFDSLALLSKALVILFITLNFITNEPAARRREAAAL